MGTTHAAAGVALATPVAALAPELAPAAALGGLLGGFFPDLDIAVGVHRRTLHFPDYYWLLALPAAAAAAVAPGPVTVAVACFSLSAAVHSVTDWFGAGPEPRPWDRTSDRAVYLHSRDRWLAPRYWVRYDGAPEDLLLAAVLSVPGLLLFGPTVRRVMAALLVVSVGYALVRRRVPDVQERFGRG